MFMIKPCPSLQFLIKFRDVPLFFIARCNHTQSPIVRRRLLATAPNLPTLVFSAIFQDYMVIKQLQLVTNLFLYFLGFYRCLQILRV